ncbi:MAG TPA: hypothetical protein VI300_14250 [Solirubrobacter sp.]
MRRWLVLCAVALSGCGVLDETGPAAPKAPDPAVYGPSKPVKPDDPTLGVPRLVEPPAALARRLDDGAIGVVDLSGTVGIEPSSLDTASDLTLSGVRWTSWGAGGASGAGTLRIVTCQPTCASSSVKDVPARIELSGVKSCSGRRYFARGQVQVDGADAASEPATYVRAPC